MGCIRIFSSPMGYLIIILHFTDKAERRLKLNQDMVAHFSGPHIRPASKIFSVFPKLATWIWSILIMLWRNCLLVLHSLAAWSYLAWKAEFLWSSHWGSLWELNCNGSSTLAWASCWNILSLMTIPGLDSSALTILDQPLAFPRSWLSATISSEQFIISNSFQMSPSPSNQNYPITLANKLS